MNIISWNVNSIRKNISDELFNLVDNHSPDIICFQETRATGKDAEKYFKNDEKVLKIYPYRYWNDSVRGHAGVSIWSKQEPNSIIMDIPDLLDLKNGRIIILEYDNFTLVNTYVPNTGRGKIAEDNRQIWHNSIMNWLKLNINKKFIIWGGDLNVVREPKLDTSHHIVRPIKNDNAGLKQFEFDHLNEYFELGLVDIFRHMYPNKKSFTWFSNFSTEKNIIGWRLDFFLTNNMSKIKDIIHNEKLDKSISDHSWIMLILH